VIASSLFKHLPWEQVPPLDIVLEGGCECRSEGRFLFLSKAWKQLNTLTPGNVSSCGDPVRNDSLDNCMASSFAFIHNKYDFSGDETMNNEHVGE
jgi:hypothetical protein